MNTAPNERARVEAPAGYRSPLRLASLLCLIALTACATPKERVVYQTVKVPVPVACAVSVPTRPSYPADTVSLDSTVFELAQAVMAERELRKAYEAELSAVAKACTEPP